jgi:2-amino-4-hydroxy-6-hydroxymethyldihydropteridine diphosphokinase
VTRVVLSVGSNLGDRLARLQAVVDALSGTVRAVSPVYETDAWGGVDQGPFLNAVVVADDPQLDAHAWLRKAQAIETANQRVREQKWGPRTLDVDLVCLTDDDVEVLCDDPDLTLPHRFAHQRAFVLTPWVDLDPDAELFVGGQRRPVRALLAELDPAERDGVRPTAHTLRVPGPS